CIVKEGHVADSFVGGSDQQRAKWTSGKTVVDLKVPAAVLVFGGGHSFDADKKVVQAPGTRQAGFIRHVKQGCLPVPLQKLLGILQADVLQKLFRTGTCPFGKQPLKMKRTQVYLFCQNLERRLLPEMLPDVVDRCRYPLVINC